jgi:hypothetical protein
LWLKPGFSFARCGRSGIKFRVDVQSPRHFPEQFALLSQDAAEIQVVQHTGDASALRALEKQEFEVGRVRRALDQLETVIAAFDAGWLWHLNSIELKVQMRSTSIYELM